MDAGSSPVVGAISILRGQLRLSVARALGLRSCAAATLSTKVDSPIYYSAQFMARRNLPKVCIPLCPPRLPPYSNNFLTSSPPFCIKKRLRMASNYTGPVLPASTASGRQYFLYREATDMCEGFNGLNGVVRANFTQDPMGVSTR